MVIRHEPFQIFGRFHILKIQIIFSKGVEFHQKITETLFLTGVYGFFRLFMASFRFFHVELSLMPG